MAIQKTPKHSTYIYSEVNVGKYKTTKHYELKSLDSPTSKLSKLINISKDRNCANSMPDYWLKKKQGNKWSKCLTGLFKTRKTLLFKGDLNKKKHLILFKFSDGASTLTIKYFENFYTKDITHLLPLFNH